MTQPGETTGMSAWDHLRVLLEHTDPRIVDAIFCEYRFDPGAVLERYREMGAAPVALDLDKIKEKGYQIIRGDVLKTDVRSATIRKAH